VPMLMGRCAGPCNGATRRGCCGATTTGGCVGGCDACCCAVNGCCKSTPAMSNATKPELLMRDKFFIICLCYALKIKPHIQIQRPHARRAGHPAEDVIRRRSCGV